MTLVLLGAGNSTRFGLPVKKQWLRIGDLPLWLFVAKRFEKMYNFANIIITAPKDEMPFFQKYCDYLIVTGGDTRQESIKNALFYVQTPYVLISDIARVCVQQDVLNRLIQNKEKADCIAPFIPSPDTVVYKNETLQRDEVKLIQTPQLSKATILQKALQTEQEFTDESSAIKAIRGEVLYVAGDIRQRKLTYKEDLHFLDCLTPPSPTTLSGTGFDVHAFCENRALYLGGEKIDFHLGLAGHSDADVALHAIIDALLGASGFGDIGELFPDNDEAFKDIDSKILLQHCVKILRQCGFAIAHIDLTILAQQPKLSPYKQKIQKRIASLLGVEKYQVNIKATTTEKLGFIGRSEGIAAQAIATLDYFDWSRK